MSSAKIFLDANYIIYLRYAEDDKIYEYCLELLKKVDEYEPITNIIVIDEVVWILWNKYGIDKSEIFEFIDRIVEFLTIIPLDEEDYKRLKELMLNYGLKPSDALHVSTMSKAKTSYIITEDGEFDSVEWIKRIWRGKEKL
jgi:predicted nucleic acid-binding protein